MKIVIDISAVIYGTGVSVYTRNLVDNLVKIDTKDDFILFGGSLRRKKELDSFIGELEGKNVKGVSFHIPPILADLVWNKLHLVRIERFVGEADVFHSSDWTQPPSNAFKVTTIHDLSPLMYPKLTDPRIIATHKRKLFWVKKEVDRIIVPTLTTANDVAALGIKQEKIRVIPEAIEPGMVRTSNQEIENLKRKYRISGKYLLGVGVNERKNTKNIIRAYEKVKSDTKTKLVVIGYQHADFDSPKGVIFTGHIPNTELATFYSGAEVLVYPSFYEGFGLPIIYAFSCETPVITSNFGSMAETANNAAVLVNPHDVGSIAKGIMDALKDKKVLVKKGIAQAKKYSWEETANKTLSVYKEFQG